MKRILMFAATATAALIAGTGNAIAAGGQQLCLGAPVSAVTTADSDGQCKRGTAVTVLTEQDLSALEARVSALEADNSSLQLQARALQSDNGALRADVAALEEKLSKVSYDASGLNGEPTVKIAGATLQIVDGSGDTFGDTNGRGNLFIGYDEQARDDRQTGSHNLVLGAFRTFTAHSGLVAGRDNAVTGLWSSALGYRNTASGENSSVSGGLDNVASGNNSSVSGGVGNTASGAISSVSGGQGNTASGVSSSILGGAHNTVSSTSGTSP